MQEIESLELFRKLISQLEENKAEIEMQLRALRLKYQTQKDREAMFPRLGREARAGKERGSTRSTTFTRPLSEDTE